MAQGDLTQKNAKICEECVTEMFNAIPKSKKLQHFGNLNEVLLFLNTAQAKLPKEEK